jgi:hypothetical protein
MTLTYRVLSFALLFALAAAAGCGRSGGGGGGGDAKAATLQDVADLLRASTQPNGQGPGKLADLGRAQEVYPRGYEAIKSGEVVVNWGVGMKGEGEMGKGGDVVAYEKDAPTAGGYVLLSGGEIKHMSAADYAAAPKPSGKK